MTFDQIFAPYDENVFLEKIIGESALYVAGYPDKFGELVSWKFLSRLMTFGGLGYPRLRLISDGQEVPKEVYLKTGNNGYPRPVVHQINSALRSGAVLAVESVEELHEPVSLLCRVFEQVFEIPVSADLNASWPLEKYSGLRRNESDLIVLQVEGRKRWQIHCPTDSEPKEDPAWTGFLERGDLLYVPARWWYSDQPLEPSLDLGVIFRNPTGLDVLQCLLNQMFHSIEMRKDCPRFGGPEKQSAFLHCLRTELAKAYARPGVLLHYLREIREQADPVVHFDLPCSASNLPPSDELMLFPLLRFPRSDSLSGALDEDAVEVFVNGKNTRFHGDAAGILQLLCERSPRSVRELIASYASDIPKDRILEALSELLTHGVLGLRVPQRTAESEEQTT